MLIGKNTEFSDSQAVTVTAISTNVVDLGATPTLRDIAEGESLDLVIQVDTTATAAGAATVTFALLSSSTVDLATTPTTHISSAAIGKATLVAGFEQRYRLPKAPVSPAFATTTAYQRYMGVNYTVATGPLTAGAFSAFIAKESQGSAQYPSGIVSPA